MWNPDDQDYEYYSSDSWIIEDIYEDEGWVAYIKAKTLTKTIPPWDPSPIRLEQDIDALNNELLKPQYYIEIPDDAISLSDRLYGPDYADDMNESDDFEFTDTDKDLAMGLDSFPIIIELINEYTFSEGGDGITLYEVKTTETNSYELEKILQLDVSYDKESIETLLKDQYFENDDLMEFLNEGKITQSIPDEYYGDDWDNKWEDFDIKVILL